MLYITSNGEPIEDLTPTSVDFYGVESGTDLADSGYDIVFTRNMFVVHWVRCR